MKRKRPPKGPAPESPAKRSTDILAEVTVRDGAVARTTLRQTVVGGCRDCGQQWHGPLAFLVVTQHTEATGHVTAAGRTVVYEYHRIG